MNYQDLMQAMQAQKNSQAGMASGPQQTIGATFGHVQQPQVTQQASPVSAGMNGLSAYLKSGAGRPSPSGFGQLGSTTQGGLGGLLGGGSPAAGAAPAAPAAGGAMGLAGAAGLGALSYLGDKEMNENKGSIINADKLNDMGTIGGSGVGLRGGDLVNGFNPATWLSDPKKAGKGLANAFTFGIFDGLM